MVRTRGLPAAAAGAAVITWVPFAVSPGSGLRDPVVQTAVVVVVLVVATVVAPRTKERAVRLLQRWVLNPAVRGAFAVGLNPLAVVLLETTRRRSGLPRRVPVGARQVGDTLWLVSEHGVHAAYVRNLSADPRVRVRVRATGAGVWMDGVAQVCHEDDAIARQRTIAGLHPLRLLNALTVRLLGTDLVTVRIDLCRERAIDHITSSRRSLERLLKFSTAAMIACR